jgi:predicted transcriptional regulator
MSEDATENPSEGADPEGEGGALGDAAVAEFDEHAVDVLSWILDTETRARIYVYLRNDPWSTSEEVADGTGLYPSTVREALAELSEEGKLDRRKRASEGAGNNPYEYVAIAPSDLVGEVVSQVQEELNALCNLDDLGEGRDEPVSIEVRAAGDHSGEEE